MSTPATTPTAATPTAAIPTAAPDTYADLSLLRLLTCGSVDDGKSTLIGRLLYDSKSIFEDQLEAVERSSRAKGDERVNLALLTDGLRAEREQGITIDVAYRYFATPARKFIVADCPGHQQYTRNMATGASTADLAVILIDARLGVIEQTRRHATIATLLGIGHLAVAVNKMDLVGWDESTFDAIRADFGELVDRASAEAGRRPAVTFFPVSALNGDNVVEPSAHAPWYGGPTLLKFLETVPIGRAAASADLGGRLPVQWVVRPQYTADEQAGHDVDYRALAGQIEAGTFAVGDEVVALPAGQRSRVKSIRLGEATTGEASAPLSVAVELADDVDVSRGDVLCPADRGRRPFVGRDLDATVVWMDDAKPLRPRSKYAIKLAAHNGRCVVRGIARTIDVTSGGTGAGDDAPAGPIAEVRLNEIARLTLRTTRPVAFDPYADCRATGGFILIDEATHQTVGAGMIHGPDPSGEASEFVI